MIVAVLFVCCLLDQQTNNTSEPLASLKEKAIVIIMDTINCRWFAFITHHVNDERKKNSLSTCLSEESATFELNRGGTTKALLLLLCPTTKQQRTTTDLLMLPIVREKINLPHDQFLPPLLGSWIVSSSSSPLSSTNLFAFRPFMAAVSVSPVSASEKTHPTGKLVSLLDDGHSECQQDFIFWHIMTVYEALAHKGGTQLLIMSRDFHKLTHHPIKLLIELAKQIGQVASD